MTSNNNILVLLLKKCFLSILLFTCTVYCQNKDQLLVDTAFGENPYCYDCTCVPSAQCKNTNGDNIINLRFQSVSCVEDDALCCRDEDIIREEKKNDTTAPKTKQPCGTRRSDGVGLFRINDNDNTEFGEFPWMIALFHEEHDSDISADVYKYKCGGSLIHPQVVLTGAHCVPKDIKKLIVRAGDWDLNSTDEVVPHQERKVQTFIIHPKYNRGSLHNDVALLFLETAFAEAENIDVVCLPPQNTNSDNSRCIATGWGKTSFNKTALLQRILKIVELPIVDHESCQAKLRTTKLGKYFILDPSFICAGGMPGVDVCTGDGGSPLICPVKGKDQYYQAGIVAWGIGCKSDVPGAYVNVALFRDWIDEQMKAQNFNISIYQY